MLTFLIHRFIPDKDNTGDAGVRRSYGILCSIVGIALNVLLFAGKYTAGLISGSVAIRADAFNNLSDAGSSFITMVGFHFSGMKPDKDHPFGHGRIEYISGLAVSVLIILMGFELAKSSVQKILHPSAIDTSPLVIGILIASILVKLYMAAYNRSIGARIDSAAMKATATDSASDTLATTVVLISTLLSAFTGIQVDGWCGVLVSVFILKAGYEAAKDTLSPLLGQAPDSEFIRQIEEIVMAHEEVVGIHDLIVHDYGPGRTMISLHGEVPGNGDIYVLHDAIDHIERELREKLHCDAVIHMDPIAVDDETVRTLKEKIVQGLEHMNLHLTLHDFRIVQGPTHTNVIFDVVIPGDCPKTEDEVRTEVEDLVRTSGENFYPVIQLDHSYV
jgi:cation diffusion facilitator family transporter